ncbi:MAG: hypothetical protein ACE5I1_33135, partial [bacterium]
DGWACHRARISLIQDHDRVAGQLLFISLITHHHLFDCANDLRVLRRTLQAQTLFCHRTLSKPPNFNSNPAVRRQPHALVSKTEL